MKVDLKMFDARYLSKTISAVIFFSLYNNIIMIVIDINIITVNIIIKISRTAPLYVGAALVGAGVSVAAATADAGGGGAAVHREGDLEADHVVRHDRVEVGQQFSLLDQDYGDVVDGIVLRGLDGGEASTILPRLTMSSCTRKYFSGGLKIFDPAPVDTQPWPPSDYWRENNMKNFSQSWYCVQMLTYLQRLTPPSREFQKWLVTPWRRN